MVIFGRHGGYETFDIPFVFETIVKMLNEHKDIGFLFLNTKLYGLENHPRVYTIPGTYDMHRKVGFIDACDAMIHARTDGETFGLAVAEFSARNKPVLTYAHSKDKHHLEVLKDHSRWFYEGPENLYHCFSQMSRGELSVDPFSILFSPDIVLKIFEEIALS